MAIVAGTILSEKLNFTGGFFEWRRPFDFSTDKGPQSQAPAARPQSPAVRGFPRFGNRSLRCTLRGVFAVVGEREGAENTRDSGLFRVDVPQAVEEIAVFYRSKK